MTDEQHELRRFFLANAGKSFFIRGTWAPAEALANLVKEGKDLGLLAQVRHEVEQGRILRRRQSLDTVAQLRSTLSRCLSYDALDDGEAKALRSALHSALTAVDVLRRCLEES